MRTPPGPLPVAGGTAELLADADRDGSWVLMVDGTPQSHVDLDDPTHLEFEYVRRIAEVLEETVLARPPQEKPLMILPVGYPAADATVPEVAKRKKPFDRVASVFR